MKTGENKNPTVKSDQMWLKMIEKSDVLLSKNNLIASWCKNATEVCRTPFYVGLRIRVDAPDNWAALRPCSMPSSY